MARASRTQFTNHLPSDYQTGFRHTRQTAEHNALSMHATMIATWPPIVYWQPESVAAMQIVWQLREQGT
ncbi:hypothetical protein THIOSC13_600003 [uncultured Thiomicrorhabdus sp.]